MKLNTKTPSGFPELTPAQESVRQDWIRKIFGIFAKYGFIPMQTPIVERTENLTSKGGNPKEIYTLGRLLDTGSDKEADNARALRFDHTVPLGLYLARNMNEITFPFKRCVIGPVFRGERAQKGRYRQFEQIDADIIGRENLSIYAEAEVLAVVAEIINTLDLGNFTIRINNRKCLIGFFQGLGEFEANEIKSLLDVVDDIEKCSAEKTLETLGTKGLSPEQSQNLITFVTQKGSPEEILENLKSISTDELFKDGIKELNEVFATLSQLGVAPQNLKLDCAIARGLDYYTGTVFETQLDARPGFGSVCSGGRYDDLAGAFTGKSMPGFGFGFGLSRILAAAFDAALVTTDSPSAPGYLVVGLDETARPKVLEVLQKLRSADIAAESYFESSKMKKIFQYAENRGNKNLILIGENEVKSGEIIVKNLETGEKSNLEIQA